MGALAPAVRPSTVGAFGKKRRSAAPAACGGVVKPSSRTEEVSVIKKVEVNGVTVEMEVIPLVAVGGGKAVVRGMKRPASVMARGSSICLAAAKEFAEPARKPTKMTSCKPNNVEITADVGALTATTETPADPARELLKKRLAAELDALRGLVKKAEHMPRARAASKGGAPTAGKTEQLLISSLRSEPKTPSMKKRKISPVAEQMQIPATSAEADKVVQEKQLVCFVSVIKTEETGSRKTPRNDEDEDEFVDICGGVSPIAVQETTTVLSPLEDGEITGNTPSSSSSSSRESDSSSSDSDSDSDTESVDSPAPPAVPSEEKSSAITGNTPRSSSSSSSESDSSSSCSESDSSSSDSDSDSDAESVDSPPPPPPPPPPALPSEEKSTAAPEPLASAVAIDKAKLQQALLEMETAALPDESVHARDLQRLGIAEYGRPRIMQQLGLFLNDDAPTAGKTEQPVASKRRSEQRVLEADDKPPLVKKRKISAPVEPTQKIQPLAAPVQSAEPKNVVQDVQPLAAPKAVYMPGLIYRAKLRLTLLEIERGVLPDESIHARDLQSLCIAEYGRPSIMRQLGLFLEDDA